MASTPCHSQQSGRLANTVVRYVPSTSQVTVTSSLTWIDHDRSAGERTQRILALFREREARDELGLGAIVGSFSDQLFPGTSTIQTRLRYMFFVPWIYKAIEAKETKQAKQEKDWTRRERALKEHEQALITALLDSGEKAGVLGQLAREGLKRYPSSVYWAGLGSWGIRGVHGPEREAQEGEGWDGELPAPPPDFPEGATFRLTVDEASYVCDKLVRLHAKSLLAHLAMHRLELDEVGAPWELPSDALLAGHRDLLAEAHRFALAMQGAAFVYNLMLAERASNDERRAHYVERLAEWRESIVSHRISTWSLDAFWPKVLEHGHAIGYPTRAFVTEWVNIAQGSVDAASSPQARQLVQKREMALKGAHSRFRSAKALQRWSGAAGVGLTTYRWNTARRFLIDLHGAQD